MSNDDFNPTAEAFVELLRNDVEAMPLPARARLAQRLEGLSLGAPELAGPAPVTHGFWRSSRAAVALALPLGALLGAGGYELLGAKKSASAPVVVAPAASLDPPPSLPRSAPAPSVSPSLPNVDEPPPTRAPRRSAPTRHLTSPPAAVTAPLTAGDDLALLERARTAFAEGDAAGSLELLASHERRYRASNFTQEREALTIRVLVALGRRSEAAMLGERFLARYPQSALRGSVARAVGGNQ